MVDILRKQLGDPVLDIVYWRPGKRHWIDDLGRPATLPTDPTPAVTCIERRGEPIAVLIHDPVLLEDPPRMRSAIWDAADLIETAWSNADLQSQLL